MVSGVGRVQMCQKLNWWGHKLDPGELVTCLVLGTVRRIRTGKPAVASADLLPRWQHTGMLKRTRNYKNTELQNSRGAEDAPRAINKG